MPMTEHTKAVLEAATSQLVALGLTRRRRGLAVWQMNDELWGGIGFVSQAHETRVRLLVVPQLVWEPIEQLVAHGKGLEYRPWNPSFVTRSDILPPLKGEGGLAFEVPEVDSATLNRLKQFVAAEAIPRVLEMADLRDLASYFSDEAPRGGGRAERALAIEAWKKRSLELRDEYVTLRATQMRQENRTRFEQFYNQLCGSTDAWNVFST